MRPADLDYIRGSVEKEGFHYAFIHYSDFDDIKDEAFHSFRKAYVEATNNLANYLNMPEERR